MRIVAAAVMAGIAVPAAADFQPLTGGGGGNAFGDDRLAYQDGVVYDDDLVPGRRPDQPFLAREAAGDTTAIAAPRPEPADGGREPAAMRRQDRSNGHVLQRTP